MATRDDVGAIDISNKDRKTVVHIGATGDGSGGIDIHNKDGKLVVRMGTTTGGKGFIQSFEDGWKTH